MCKRKFSVAVLHKDETNPLQRRGIGILHCIADHDAVHGRELAVSDQPADPCISLLAVSGCPVAFSICFFAAFVSSLFSCSIPPLALEMIDPSFRVDPYNRIVRAMLLCLLLRVEVRDWIYIGRAEA